MTFFELFLSCDLEMDEDAWRATRLFGRSRKSFQRLRIINLQSNCIWRRKGLEIWPTELILKVGVWYLSPPGPHPEKIMNSYYSSTFSTVCVYLFSAVKIFPTSSFSLTSFLLRAHWFNIVHFSLTPLFLRFFTCNTHTPVTRVSNVYGVEEAEFIIEYPSLPL